MASRPTNASGGTSPLRTQQARRVSIAPGSSAAPVLARSVSSKPSVLNTTTPKPSALNTSVSHSGPRKLTEQPKSSSMVELPKKERESPDTQLLEQKRALEQQLADQKRALQSTEQTNNQLSTRVQSLEQRLEQEGVDPIALQALQPNDEAREQLAQEERAFEARFQLLKESVHARQALLSETMLSLTEIERGLVRLAQSQ